MPSDLHDAGLVRRELPVSGRNLLLTVDFEAFTPESAPLWAAAMRRWAERARAHDLHFAFFVSVEDLALVRAESPAGWAEMLEAARALHDAGARFHPHNHCIFDRDTGEKPTAHTGFPQQIEGYPRRASMYYDVVYRCEHDWAEWLGEVVAEYDRFLSEAGIPRPERPVFRPGGWDHGITPEDLRAYLDGLAAHGFAIDSSATSGGYGTPSWTVGLPFGASTQELEHGVMEVAPSWSLDCGAGLASLPGAKALSELRRHPRLWLRGDGVLDAVLHFDHLFHTGRGSARTYWAVNDPEVVNRRVDRAVRQLARLRSALRLRSVTYEQLRPEATGDRVIQ